MHFSQKAPGVNGLSIVVYQGVFIKIIQLRFSKYNTKVLKFTNQVHFQSDLSQTGRDQHCYVFLTPFSIKKCWEILITCLVYFWHAVKLWDMIKTCNLFTKIVTLIYLKEAKTNNFPTTYFGLIIRQHLLQISAQNVKLPETNSICVLWHWPFQATKDKYILGCSSGKMR